MGWWFTAPEVQSITMMMGAWQGQSDVMLATT